MYLKRLEFYTADQWKKILKPFPPSEWEKIKQALTLSSKEAIEGYFPYFWRIGLINGIGASWMWAFARRIITGLFPGVRFEFHDIEYLIGGDQNDKERADFGLFKYSILSIVENYKKIHSLEVNFLIKELFIVLYTFFAIIKLLILIFFWRVLIYFWGKAFNF